MNVKMQFWFRYGSESLQLPVNPSSFEVSSPYGIEIVEVNHLGEVEDCANSDLSRFYRLNTTQPIVFIIKLFPRPISSASLKNGAMPKNQFDLS